MEAKIGFFTRRLAALSFTLGTACLILSFLLNISYQRAGASGSSPSNLSNFISGDCDGGYIHKQNLAQEKSGDTYRDRRVITRIFIKDENGSCSGYTANQLNGCFIISGLQSIEVSVSETGGEGCPDIAHIEYYADPGTCCDPTLTPLPPTDTPTSTLTQTPTSTHTETPVPATETPTQTATPLDTETATPTSTATLTITPTGGDVPPVITTPPTETATASPTPTEIIQPFVDTPTPTSLPLRVSSPTPTEVIKPPLATLPPPAATPRFKQPELVPVTGEEHLLALPSSKLPQQVFLGLGAALIGLALVLYGVSKKFP
jgi:hypothetical protein